MTDIIETPERVPGCLACADFQSRYAGFWRHGAGELLRTTLQAWWEHVEREHGMRHDSEASVTDISRKRTPRNP